MNQDLATPAPDQGPAVPRIAVDVVVSGFVQGVGFRYQCAQYAWSIGACGWVLNRPDGKVEIHIEGSQRQVDQVTRWCWNGPRFASVDDVKITPGVDHSRSGFEIR